MKKADQWSGLALLLCAVGIIWAALGLPFGDIRKPGPGFFPFWLGMILLAMSIGLIAQSTLTHKGTKTIKGIGEEDVRWGKILLVLTSLILYAFLMEYIGFLVVTFLLMVVLLRFIEPQSWKVVIGLALAGSLGSYLIFEVWMKLRLPKGFWGL